MHMQLAAERAATQAAVTEAARVRSAAAADVERSQAAASAAQAAARKAQQEQAQAEEGAMRARTEFGRWRAEATRLQVGGRRWFWFRGPLAALGSDGLSPVAEECLRKRLKRRFRLQVGWCRWWVQGYTTGSAEITQPGHHGGGLRGTLAVLRSLTVCSPWWWAQGNTGSAEITQSGQHAHKQLCFMRDVACTGMFQMGLLYMWQLDCMTSFCQLHLCG